MLFGQTTQEFPIFGQMKYKSYWMGAIEISAFATNVEVIVRAKKQGPSQAQIQAMTDFLPSQNEIKHASITAFLQLYANADVEMDEHQLWQDLQLEQIEVTDEQYDQNTHNISVLMIFSSKLFADFCPAIEVIHGEFIQVLSGT